MVDILPPIRSVEEISANTGRSQSPPTKPAGAGDIFSRVYEIADGMEAEGAEGRADLFRAFVEAEFRSLGIPLDLKSKAEREFAAMQNNLAQVKMQEQMARVKVNQTVGFLMDNAGTPVGELFPDLVGRTETLQDAIGLQLDQSLLGSPENLMRASRALAQAAGDESLALSNTELLFSEFTKEAAAKTREERGREESGREVKAQRDLQAQAEFRAAEEEGEGIISQLLRGRLESAGEAVNQDLTPGFILNDDLDTAAGSQAAVQAMLGLADDLTSRYGIDQGTALSTILKGEVGQRIVGELNDIAPDEAGEMRLIGDFGLEPLATANYAILLDEAARRSSRSVGELMREIGLPFTGINQDELSRAIALFRGQASPEAQER